MRRVKPILTFLFLLFLVTRLFGSNSNEEEKQKVAIELEFIQKQPKSNFDKYYGFYKGLLTPAIVLFGILMTLPILRRKLTENHITTSLNNIQAANSKIQSFSQKLIDKYLPLTFSNELLSKQDIENAFDDLQKGYHISQKGSSDVATLMFYLKTTIQSTIKHYDPSNSKLFSTRGFLGYLIDNLELVNFYSTQVVQIPKSSKTERHNLITKSIRKYVTHSHIVQYKHFKLGVIEDPNSAHFIMFCEKTNRTNHALLMRSAFQIYWSPNAIAKLLFINKIYAPSILEMPHNVSLFGTDKLSLYLVGFSISNQISQDPNEPNKVVDLLYSNPDDVHRFVTSLSYTKLKSKFSDKWIENSEFDLCQSNSMTKTEIETFRLKYDKNYLQEKFERNKRKIKRKLKITVPNNA